MCFCSNFVQKSSRSECNSLVTIGGAHADGRPSDVASFYDYKMKKWRTLVNLEVPVKHHGIAVMGGFIWVVGGMNRNSETIATGYRYCCCCFLLNK